MAKYELGKRVNHDDGRKIRSDSAYDQKYVKELESGIRYTKALSVVELCRRWRISRVTYNNWKKTYPEFRHAAEMGDLDYATWWHETFKDIATGEKKGNANAAIFALTNVDQINWTSKATVETKHEEKINKIQIEVLPKKENRVIEHEQDKLEYDESQD